MKYTQIPADAFKNLQLNAGVLLDSFTPSSGVIGNIIGATTGGVNFTATPTYTDFGEDIDNCPKNMKELKKLDTWEVTLSGTFVSVTTDLIAKLMGAGAVDSSDNTKVLPAADVADTNFEDIWWVGDYGEGGGLAIHVLNALSTGGFQMQSGDKAKGNFAFEFTGHYSMAAQTKVPFEVYVIDK
ncbi:MAG: hypothetical protein MJZ26_12250 [Fibrobacter sp.]|nr:hypothetical protein [Fibrobacter sp.]